MDIGLVNFGTTLIDPHTGQTVSQRERFREVVDGAVLAEELGYDWYALGEHHFGEHDLISSPPVVLAAIAQRTSKIALATGTTLVANRDPVLVAEDYATVDLLSDGRLQIISGGSFFPEPYVVFDQDPARKAERKRENLELLMRLFSEESVTWQGEFRSPLTEVLVQPRLMQETPPVWVSGGSAPDSAELAVDLGLPMVFGTIARAPEDHVPTFRRYRDLWAERGRPPEAARTGAASHVFVAETSQEAKSLWRDYFANYFSRGKLPPGAPRRNVDFDEAIGPHGPAICGSPAEVVDKLGTLHELWGQDLHLMAIDIGGIPYAKVSRAMELVASDVIPQVANLGSDRKAAARA